MSNPLITSIAHINLIIPHGTLDQAKDFYGNTLGLTPRAVPERQKTTLAWFDIADSGQQVHIAFGPDEAKSSRHPCFRIGSPDALLELRQRIWEHHEKGGEAAPLEADRPGEENSGMSSSQLPRWFGDGCSCGANWTKARKGWSTPSDSSRGILRAIGWSLAFEGDAMRSEWSVVYLAHDDLCSMWDERGSDDLPRGRDGLPFEEKTVFFVCILLAITPGRIRSI